MWEINEETVGRKPKTLLANGGDNNLIRKSFPKWLYFGGIG